MTNDFASIKEADVMLVIGSNTTDAHPVIGSWIKENKQNGKKLIVCDPRKIELAKYADVYLRQRSGSDVALLNGFMHVIIKEDLYDKAFVEERTENFEALKALVAAYDPQRVSEITGIAPEDIVNAARLYAKGPNSAIFYTMGITQHTTGTDNVRSVANLAMLCGHLGRPGTGVNPLRGQNNVQGACDMGCLPNVLPGYAKVADPAVREKVKNLWGAELPLSPGKSLVKMLEAAGEGELKSLYVMGENPMVSDADTNHVRHALEALDFLVVQDIFLTETAQLADVVFPAACWAEKDGTFTNTMRAVQRIRKAVNAPGEAKADWEILVALAKKCGADWNFSSASEIFDDLARFVPSYAGMNYTRLEQGALCWPCPNAEHPGTPILHSEKFARPNGKGFFSPCEWKAPHEWPDEEYPFLASTGRLLYHYHTRSMTGRSATEKFVDELHIEINPVDAEQIGVREGELLCVSSRRGEVRGKAKITEKVPPKMVFVPFHFGEAPANALTAAAIDPTSETPAFKISAVRVQKG